MRTATTARRRFAFRRDLLPSPADYYREEGIKLTGGGVWKSARCPFHDDTRPSLRVHLDTGAFRCMTCGAHGGDVLIRGHHLGWLPWLRGADDHQR
jgi:hypothetical protein